MPRQNRVTPSGEIIAHSARGTFMGNRGILHNRDKSLGRSRWRHKAWIICLLAFKNRHSDVMPRNGYTRLFFLDEAVALAAGHRPCAECRHRAYASFKTVWMLNKGLSSCRAAQMDSRLHHERVQPLTRTQRTTQAPLTDLPNGTFIQLPDHAPTYLVWGDGLYAYEYTHYAAPIQRPIAARVSVLTPPSTVQVLKAGYQPEIDASLTASIS